MSSIPLSPHDVPERPQKYGVLQASVRPNMSRAASSTRVGSKGRIHSYSVDSPLPPQQRLGDYGYESTRGVHTPLSPHEAVLKARLEDVLLRATTETPRGAHRHPHGRSKSYSITAGQSKPWGSGGSEEQSFVS